MSHPARLLPPMNDVLARRRIRGLGRRLRRDILVSLVRESLARHRDALRSGSVPIDGGRDAILRHIETDVLKEADSLLAPGLRTVLNATGVLLHTNLGRALLGEEARAELERVAAEPVALEIDLDDGRRGQRHARVARWISLLTGAEAALVVNNGAAALWLCVQGLASRRRAVISRGELVAIGGSFRMPELLRSTSAKIVEVGTTNRTRRKDYATELREGDVVVKVHPSNYRIEGFTEEVELPELARLCREKGASLIFDAGSGSLYNFGKFGLRGETPVAESLRDGVDLITFSGDKLLAGPQAGLIAGRRELVERLARHPLQRALRCDKLTLAALESTLRAYAHPGKRPTLPLFERLARPQKQLKAWGQRVASSLTDVAPVGWEVRVERSRATLGGGSFANETVPSIALRIRGPQAIDAERMARRLRRGEPAVLVTVKEGSLLADLKAFDEGDLDTLERACARAWLERKGEANAIAD